MPAWENIITPLSPSVGLNADSSLMDFAPEEETSVFEAFE
jgi:hypothetical protein